MSKISDRFSIKSLEMFSILRYKVKRDIYYVNTDEKIAYSTA